MSIRHRISLLIALALASILSIGGYTLFHARANRIAVQKVTGQVLPSVLASADLVSRAKDLHLATINLIDAPGSGVDPIASARLKAAEQRLAEALDRQLGQAGSDRERGLVSEARENLGEYFNAIDQTVRLRAEGKTDLARVSLVGSVAPYQSIIEQVIETLRVEKGRSEDAAIEALDANLARDTGATALITALALTLLSTFGLALYRQVNRPLTRMQAEMSEIASSQDLTRRLAVDRDDEIGCSMVAFNAMIERIEQASLLLRQKTTDMQSMLQHMPQGILTIASDNRVHPEYSAYLETILETRDIAGRDIIGLLFAGTELGADTLARLEAAIAACIGEHLMNFEFNEHLLVGGVEKRMPGGTVKILDLNWSPVTDDTGTIQRLLLCVRDVTELRELAAQASAQKRELEVIGELLSLGPEKFHQFMGEATDLIERSEALLKLAPRPATASLHQVYRNLHTIKGNARTYGLLHLTHVVHESEHSYAVLAQGDPAKATSGRELLDGLGTVREAIRYYAHVHELRLGRKRTGRTGQHERFLMVEREMIQQALRRLEAVSSENIHELVAARDAVARTLRLLGTEPLRVILDGVLESLPALARELGKAPPIVAISNEGYLFHTHVAGMLANVFMHLLRNAVDHGLETPEARLADGKPAQGRIELQLARQEGQLAIRLRDDGRGLALARIRECALARGLISANQDIGDAELAALILRSGFSTADRVSEVSGRGVGMDAAQGLVRASGGHIELRLLDAPAHAGFHAFETVIWLPGHLAEEVAAPAAAGDGRLKAAATPERRVTDAPEPARN